MKQLSTYLSNYIYDIEYNYMLNEQLSSIISDEIINESFKSTLLSNLAKKIFDVEAKHRDEDKERAKRYKEQGYSNPGVNAKSFASIFGPQTVVKRYGGKNDGLQGLKWSEITDNDFILYEKGCDKKKEKELINLIKQTGFKKAKTDFILCKSGTKEPMAFIKGYGIDDKYEPAIYTFFYTSWKGNNIPGVHRLTKSKYKYSERNLKWNEIMEVINQLDVDVYALPITDDMIKDYKSFHNDRKESQKGIINYDADSLKQLLDKQKARYKTLVNEIKAKKLESNVDDLFNDLKTVNDEVADLYKEITSNPENIDKFYDLGSLMHKVADAYDDFYRYNREKRDLDKRIAKYGKSYDDDSFYKSQMQNYIRSVKDTIDNIYRLIAEIREKI